MVHCGECRAIIDLSAPCPVCGKDYSVPEPETLKYFEEHQEWPPNHRAFAGADDWTSYVLLNLMQREWERPLFPEDFFVAEEPNKQLSQRLVIVILFWSLFENLIDRLLTDGMFGLPKPVQVYLLKSNWQISARTEKLYKVLFETTFFKDLESLGLTELVEHLKDVQDKRNKFVHNDPQAITEGLVSRTVERLPELFRAWVAVYNLRIPVSSRAR